ncbi:type VI secretion system protein ImpH [Rhizobium sp. RU35A]|uniref:type VI secretion system baseplate subunit TssG n=1 Tax=Rhizobium sp. RU35A TaxID=1907414 RepID=UPI000954A31F|nr:type VI secretion system baseplate subunit TssG [Rhizobium sp. RU35A]SIQ49136.1 type VI secretion system protein ImpH [Rhizobium sp. RU35A]
MDAGSVDQFPDVLAERLVRDPGSFEPVTALRVAQAVSPDGLDVVAPVGVDPAPLAVSGFERSERRSRIRSLFASLSGPVGALPPSYNQLILREERQRSRAFSAFLDVFNGRISELFADACEKYRLARALRWQGKEAKAGFLRALLSLGGFGTRRTVERAGISRDLPLRFSGFFADRTRHASGLAAMLEELTGAPVQIEQFRPRWLTIPPAERSRIGQPQGLQLGTNASAGSRFRDQSGGFRVVIGPLHYGDYLRLSPDARAMGEIVALTRLYVGPSLDFDVQVVLRKEDVPETQLGRSGDPPRLGWNAWARIAPAARDSGDAVVQAMAVENMAMEVQHAP